MGQVANSLALGSQVEYEGKVYRISPWTYKIQGKYESYLERVAKQEAAEWPGLSRDERQDLCKSVHQDVVLGVYSFGETKALESFNSPKHFIHLLWLCMKPEHPTITEEFVAVMFEANPKLLMNAMQEANADPTMPPAKELLTSSE